LHGEQQTVERTVKHLDVRLVTYGDEETAVRVPLYNVRMKFSFTGKRRGKTITKTTTTTSNSVHKIVTIRMTAELLLFIYFRSWVGNFPDHGTHKAFG